MQRRPLGDTGLESVPLVLGGNVFGWTADERTSFSLLVAFVDLASLVRATGLALDPEDLAALAAASA